MTDATLAPSAAAASDPAAGTGRGRRFAALLVKESLQIVRDPSSILIAVVLPLILLFLFGYGVSLDADHVKIGLAVEATSEPGQSLAAAFRASRFFDVREAHDRRALEPLLVAGTIRGIVVIPAHFGEEAAQNVSTAKIQVITDGSEPNTAKFVENYAQGVWSNWIASRGVTAGAPAIGLEPRFWFNPELRSRYFLVPGVIAIVMTLVGTLLTALVVAREWERGTMEAMMATPISTPELILGKLIPYFVLGLGAMAMCTSIGVFLFGVPLRGSLLALLAISSAFLMPALGQGLLISSALKNQFVASQAALLSGFLPAMLLSGFVFEIPSMPKVIQLFTYIVPARYLIPSLQTVFLAGDIWPLFLKDIAAMLAIGSVFLILTVRSTRKSLE
ncbi:MAG: ABC transporter permease [Rhodomicrobiaceae bacterium]